MINIEIVKIEVMHVSIRNNIYEYIPYEKIKKNNKDMSANCPTNGHKDALKYYKTRHNNG